MSGQNYFFLSILTNLSWPRPNGSFSKEVDESLKLYSYNLYTLTHHDLKLIIKEYII